MLQTVTDETLHSFQPKFQIIVTTNDDIEKPSICLEVGRCVWLLPMIATH